MSNTIENGANLDAISRYMSDTPVKTQAASRAKDAWVIWYDGLDFIDKNWPSQQVYDMARNLRNAFNKANATTPKELAAVVQTQQTGLSSEQLQGQSDRRLATGDYIEAPEPFVPLRIKIVAFLTLLGIGAGYAAKKAYVDPFIRRRF